MRKLQKPPPMQRCIKADRNAASSRSSTGILSSSCFQNKPGQLLLLDVKTSFLTEPVSCEANVGPEEGIQPLTLGGCEYGVPERQ